MTTAACGVDQPPHACLLFLTMQTIDCSEGSAYMSPICPLPRAIAHRGAPRHAPENTIPAFAAAKKLGASWVETDVLLSRDDETVIFHDNWLDRTTNAKGRLRDIDAQEVFALDAGSWKDETWKDVRVPSLRETLEFCRDAGLGLNLELKHANDDEMVIPNAEEMAHERKLAHAACDAVEDFESIHESILFSSYSYTNLEVCKQRMPHIKRGLLVNSIPANWPELVARFDCCCMSFWADDDANTDKLVQEVSKSIPLYAFSINDAAAAAQMLSLGCRGVFTDALDKVGETLSS